MSKQELFGLLRLLSALESILLSHKVPTPDYLFEAMGASVDALEREILAEDSDFKEAVLDELVSLHASPDGTARELVKKVIELNCQIALDPRVSSEASSLVVDGLQRAAHACRIASLKPEANCYSCISAIEDAILRERVGGKHSDKGTSNG